MTFRKLKDLVNGMTETQLNQDVAIMAVHSEFEEIYQQEVEFANPLIPIGPMFEDSSDVLDPDHCYIAFRI